MSDKKIRAIDPLGIIALANVLVQQGQNECSCQQKPVPPPQCSCEDKPVCSCDSECSCEHKPTQTDLIGILTNPAFRNAVKGLDINSLKSLEDFVDIADGIRTKIDSSRLPSDSSET